MLACCRDNNTFLDGFPWFLCANGYSSFEQMWQTNTTIINPAKKKAFNGLLSFVVSARVSVPRKVHNEKQR